MSKGKINCDYQIKQLRKRLVKIMINNEVSKICRTMKMSNYNIIVKDRDDNLVIYNFLAGLPSLTKVMKSEADAFSKVFFNDPIIKGSNCEKYIEITKKLLEVGILVDSNIDESVLFEAKTFEEIYDNRLFLTILPTGKCNFNCSYCLEAEQPLSRERMTVSAQEAVIKFVQKNIHNYSGLHVVWFGGEPLLEISTIKQLSEKLIKICKARCIPYTAQTTTNGFCLDGATFNAMYKHKVYNYMITVDGFKEQHDKCRYMHNGAGTYDTIMKNLIEIRDNKQYRFAHITIRVNITREVLDVMDEFILYLDSTFSNDPRFSFLFMPVVNYSKTKPTDETFVSKQEVSERLRNNSVYMDKFMQKNTSVGLITPTDKCLASLKNSYVFAPDLRVYKCNAHYDRDDNCIGYIDLDGNMRIDNALHGKWYLMDEILHKIDNTCDKCFYRPACYINGKNCPYQYLKNVKERNTCPLKINGFSERLEKEVLDAAEKFSCFVVSM